MNLAGLTDPVVLDPSDSWPDVHVFSLGNWLELISQEAVVALAVRAATDWAKREAHWDDDIKGWTLKRTQHGEWVNDRGLAEGLGYAWCVNRPGDVDQDWTDELGLAEFLTLHKGDEEEPVGLLDNWQELVNADPERYWPAPLGPFPGTMVVLEVRYE